MSDTLSIILIIALSYLVGSFPTAIIVSKLFFKMDIRKHGSGNMGSTNAFRVLGWKWGIVVQAVDVLKGLFVVLVIATYFGKQISFPSINYFEDLTIAKFIAGFAAVIGHIWSVFAGFRGGKGVNTTAGMLFGIAPIDTTIAIGVFALAVIFSGYISLGSITGAIALPSSMIIRYNLFNVQIPGYSILIYSLCVLTLLLIFAHRKNIIRLVKGTENKFSKLQLIKIRMKKSVKD
ncbi:MAG: Glycerol-3-phosphate acyltransferase [Ignavibacteria bacterium]|nr:Glycerol-3-phosphate acyltransferase [Ignavibacteria bacterium]